MTQRLGTVAVICTILIAGAVWQGTERVVAQPRGHSPTPGEVVASLQEALNREDWRSVARHYARDAFILADDGIVFGHGDIITWHQSYEDLFSGVNPHIRQVDEFRDVVRVLYDRDGGWVVIPDGVMTYVVENGLITKQTSHGLLEFTGPPPDQQ
jgi:limonene-1,2-epoxide hydrolase